MQKPAIPYSASVAERICDELTSGKTLREVCRGDKMPTEAAVRQWVRDDRDGFKQRYDTARELGCDALNDKLLELTDGAAPENAPLFEDKSCLYHVVSTEYRASPLREQSAPFPSLDQPYR
jgi:hypothetical protein